MISPNSMRGAVEAYLSLIERRDPEALTRMFADGAVLEDPNGSAAKSGTEAIRAHFDRAAQYDIRTEMLALRMAGNSAAVYFKTTTTTEKGTAVSSPIDVFTFDDEGLIVSLRAFWGSDDYTAGVVAEAALQGAEKGIE